MKITEIRGEEIKIGTSSITVKRDDGKTKGVVTNCISVTSTMPPRTLFEVRQKLKKSGIDIMELWSAKYINLVISGGELYLLHNIGKMNDWKGIAEKLGNSAEHDLKAIAKSERLISLAESCKEITVINHK